LLVGSLLLIAQASLVHVYSHHLSGLGSSESSAPEQAQQEPLCDFCISLLQFESGVTSHHEWHRAAQALPDFQAVSACPATPRTIAERLARGPPVFS
jgi:hypothetical protein